MIQKKEIEHMGGSRPVQLDIRIISATNRHLEHMVASGKFREDLWFILNVFPIMILPLRQRKRDISSLAHHFIGEKSRELKVANAPVLMPSNNMKG